MIDYQRYCKIHEAHHQRGLTIAQIARELKMDSRTVARWLATDKFQQRRQTPRPGKLDPFKGQIVAWLQSHPYSATQVFQRLREAGYTGGISIVKEFVHQVRPPRKPAFLTLAFAPGECAQVDWGQFGSVAVGNTRRRLSFFVMVLCHSRMLYVQFTPTETMEQFLDCHVNALNFFGGAPRKIMVDNLRSAVLQRIVGESPVFNPRYKDLADHYGFTIAPCGVGQPQEKGRVENAVGYVKKNFLAGLEPGDFTLVNPAARLWLDGIANVRVHGTTKRKPVELFAAERACLKTLPLFPYDVGVIRPARANSQFRVIVDTNSYSVPAEYAGTAVTLKLYPGHVCIYQQDKLIARHVRGYDRRQDFENPDHVRELLKHRRRASDQKLLQRLLALTPRAQPFYQAMAERCLNLTHHVRKIVALSEIYGIEKTARAIDDAMECGAFRSDYIANLLEQRQRVLPEPGALHLTRRQDLLDLELPEPNIDLYGPGTSTVHAQTTPAPDSPTVPLRSQQPAASPVEPPAATSVEVPAVSPVEPPASDPQQTAITAKLDPDPIPLPEKNHEQE